jgi:hypothetical protein
MHQKNKKKAKAIEKLSTSSAGGAATPKDFFIEVIKV